MVYAYQFSKIVKLLMIRLIMMKINKIKSDKIITMVIKAYCTNTHALPMLIMETINSNPYVNIAHKGGKASHQHASDCEC